MKHPRASELGKLIRAVEGAGKHVSAVEVRWEEIDGRDVPVWRILTSEEPSREPEPIQW